jgi:hypothetical protein
MLARCDDKAFVFVFEADVVLVETIDLSLFSGDAVRLRTLQSLVEARNAYTVVKCCDLC